MKSSKALRVPTTQHRAVAAEELFHGSVKRTHPVPRRKASPRHALCGARVAAAATGPATRAKWRSGCQVTLERALSVVHSCDARLQMTEERRRAAVMMRPQ